MPYLGRHSKYGYLVKSVPSKCHKIAIYLTMEQNIFLILLGISRVIQNYGHNAYQGLYAEYRFSFQVHTIRQYE